MFLERGGSFYEEVLKTAGVIVMPLLMTRRFLHERKRAVNGTLVPRPEING
jgi:hypothetical protein